MFQVGRFFSGFGIGILVTVWYAIVRVSRDHDLVILTSLQSDVHVGDVESFQERVASRPSRYLPGLWIHALGLGWLWLLLRHSR